MSEVQEGVVRGRDKFVAHPVEERFVLRLLSLVQEELTNTGDRDWLVDTVAQASVRISHIEGVARRVASGLSRLGLSHGQYLHMAVSSCLDFYWPVFGGWLCGAVVSAGDPGLGVKLLAGQIRDTKATIIVCSAKDADRMVAANKMMEEEDRAKHILVIDREAWQDLPEGCSSFRKLFNDDGSCFPKPSSLPDVTGDEAAVVHWSSGTTGVPKGIVMSQHYLHQMLKPSKLPPHSVSLNSNIMFHAGAFLLPLDGGIMNRFTCCFIKESDYLPSLCMDMISKYKPLFYMCGTNHCVALAGQEAKGRDLSSLKCVMPAGGAISEATYNRLKKLLPGLAMLFQFYGTSEVGGVTASLNNIKCLGGLLAGVEVYIRDTKTGLKLGVGETGEVMAKTPTTMLRYLNRQEETHEFLDKEGFAHLGDLGYFDDEGRLYYQDRIKELIKVNNYWFGPMEIENVVEEMDGVVEVAVWGKFDKEQGDDIVDVGVVTTGTKEITSQHVINFVATKLPKHKQISGNVHFLDQIPHNPQGKKLRKNLKEKFGSK